MQVGAPRQDLVVDRGAARQLADAALQGLAHAQQAADVAALGVEAQLPRPQRARAGGQARLSRGIHCGSSEYRPFGPEFVISFLSLFSPFPYYFIPLFFSF